MIKEAYCNYEVSELLKEKGFDEECTHYYSYEDDELIEYTNGVYSRNSKDCHRCTSPTHQMACAWLRDKKYISIVIDDEIPLSYKYIIKKYNITELYKVEVLKLDSLPFAKYEDAVEAAIKYCLENLI